MLILRKLLKLPGPVELGRSQYNALPSRDFTPDTENYCWEDWHTEVKALHPIKYWIAETAGDFWRYKIWLPFTRPFKAAHYWLVSHLIPSRRYHILDLRQTGEYQYGWVDVSGRMLYAIFNLLKEYFDEKPYDLTTNYTLEEINADSALKNQHEILQEAKTILQWWQVGRKQEQKNYDDLLHQWCKLCKVKATRDNGEADRDNGEADRVWIMLNDVETNNENKIDEMIARLMKIRRSLWT